MYNVDIQCPACGGKLKVPLGHLSKGHSRRCHSCGATIEFEGDGGKKAEQALKKFERDIKRCLSDSK